MILNIIRQGINMASSAVSPVSNSSSAFGLSFQSLLQIILTQLTYQDPLKPMDNFEFVSQLAQFTQLQQSQTLNDNISNLLSAQSASQATSLLGKTVDATSNGATVTGIVKSVSFSSGQSTLTIQTSSGSTVSQIAVSAVTQVQ